MPTNNVIQTDFLAGEISPRLETQDNTEGRKHGVELAENWEPTLQGSIRVPHGAQQVAELATDEEVCRLFPFRVNRHTNFAIVVVDGRLSVYEDTGLVRRLNFVSNSRFLLGLQDWTPANAGTGSTVEDFGAVILRCEEGHEGDGGSSYARVYQEMSVAIGELYDFVIHIPESTGRVKVSFGSSGGGDDIAASYHQANEKIIQLDGIASTTTTLSVQIEVWDSNASVTVSSVRAYRPIDPESYEVHAAPWGREYLDRVQEELIPDTVGNYLIQLVFASNSHPPYYLEYTPGIDLWDFDALTLTDAPAKWGSLAVPNYPSAIGVYGGRLWLGGTALFPNMFWASKVGAIGTFTLGATDEDAIEAELQTGGSISWITGAQGRGLLIGTDKEEYSIYASGGVITPSDIQSALQSSFGSRPSKSANIGNQILYASADGKKVRKSEYEWTKDSWRSSDLTFSNDNITRYREIKHLDYAANPDSQIIGLTDDYELVVLTYNITDQSIGASRRSTQGRVLSATVVPYKGRGEVWWVVARAQNSGIKYQLEKISKDVNISMDSHVAIYAPLNPTTGEPVPISSGQVPHLAGQTCRVLVDGALHPDVVPDASGDFTLEYSGVEILIGLQILNRLVTLPVEGGTAREGSTRPMKKRLIEIGMKIVDSWRPKVNGQRLPNRRVLTPMGEGEAARTEVIKVANSGWGDTAQVTIEQDLPFPTELAGWWGRIEQEEI